MEFIKKFLMANDRIFNIFYKPILIFLIVVAFLNYFKHSTGFAQAWNGWIVGDWLINYSGGFARRGLFGQIVKQIHEFSGFEINKVVSSVQIFFSFVYFALVGYFVARTKFGLERFLSFVSPLFILFYIYDETSVGRKEIMLLCTYMLWIFALEKFNSLNCTKYVLVITISFLMTLSHELFFFYVAYFGIAAYLMQRNVRKSLMWFAPVLIGSVLGLLLILFFGVKINSLDICESLIEMGANPNVCDGIINYKFNTVESAVGNVQRKLGFFKVAIPLALAFQIFPLVAFKVSLPNIFFKHIAYLFGMAFIVSIPLFILAIDWGRWLHIHYSLLVLTLFVLPNNRNEGSKDCLCLSTGERLIYPLAGLTIFILLLFIKIRTCCGSNIFTFVGVKGPGFISDTLIYAVGLLN